MLGETVTPGMTYDVGDCDMEGAPARKWWEYTEERKRYLAARQNE